jgi:hypothetical protein
VIVGVMMVGVTVLVIFSPDSTVRRHEAKLAEEADETTLREKRPWTLGRVVKATLIGVGRYCYSYFTPFTMRDFMWAWLSTGFFWTGNYTLTNFMQFYYAVRSHFSITIS